MLIGPTELAFWLLSSLGGAIFQIYFILIFQIFYGHSHSNLNPGLVHRGGVGDFLVAVEDALKALLYGCKYYKLHSSTRRTPAATQTSPPAQRVAVQ